MDTDTDRLSPWNAVFPSLGHYLFFFFFLNISVPNTLLDCKELLNDHLLNEKQMPTDTIELFMTDFKANQVSNVEWITSQ